MITATSQRELYRLQREAIAAEIKEKDEHGRPRWTYAEIAERRSISRERVSQIAASTGVARKGRQVRKKTKSEELA